MPPEATHLVILLHGILGGPDNLSALRSSLEASVPGVLIFTPVTYQRTLSFDGVDVCGERVLVELREFVSAHSSLCRLSLIGYSFGGLVARYLAGALLLQDWLSLKPCTFATFATPHVGALLPASTYRLAAMKNLGLSGLQMALGDEEMLMMLMATPGSVFMRGLAAFVRRVVYANAADDRTVPFWTSFIAEWNGEGNEPHAPPAGHAPRADLPHIEWEGSGADASGGEAVEDNLQPGQRLRLALLSPLLMVAVPLWLCLVPSFLVYLAASKRHTLKRPPGGRLSAAMRDVGGEDWETVLPRLQSSFGPGGLQAWMAAQLNTAGWHKVSVRFRRSVHGLQAVHTHGLLVVRRRGNEAGQDVLAHFCRSFEALERATT
jgi:Putative serine esterase (DUF676)